jgi:hypothetical protein
MTNFTFQEELFLGKAKLNGSSNNYKGGYVIFHQTYKDDLLVKNGKSTRFYVGENFTFLESYLRGALFGKTPQEIQVYTSIPQSRGELEYPKFEFESFDKKKLEKILKDIGFVLFFGKIKEGI